MNLHLNELEKFVQLVLPPMLMLDGCRLSLDARLLNAH